MAEIQFPAYRDYYANRVKVNDAMTALLVGSRLAGHTLSLTAGSTATLGQLFPAVEHIERFNLRSDLARDFLSHADHHIASVAIPYALATHEDFVMGVLKLLQSQGKTLLRHVKSARAWNMHAMLFEACGKPQPESIESFHVLREMRNCITHAGGGVDQGLRDAMVDMGSAARSGWADINLGAAPEDIEDADGQLALTAELVFTAFAVTKRLGREINAALGQALDGLAWARMAVEDYDGQSTKPRNSAAWRRALVGYVRHHYTAAQISERDLETAARQLNRWTVATWK